MRENRRRFPDALCFVRKKKGKEEEEEEEERRRPRSDSLIRVNSFHAYFRRRRTQKSHIAPFSRQSAFRMIKIIIFFKNVKLVKLEFSNDMSLLK